DLRKAARKELQAILVSRMTDVIKGLGHSGEGLRKMIRKASRKISGKLTAVLDDGPEAAREKKLPEKTEGKQKASADVLKPVAKKELVKARKVVARAGSGRKPLSSGVLTTSVAAPESGNPVLEPDAAAIPVARLNQEISEPDEKPGDDPVSPS
ncbi:MAG TPA: hypothetical protein VGE15_05525, partial [Sphingobacteriaceae bacterium]